ncbi:hypothetical protein EDC96DRAFT_573907 [Choanephora cucurbitarum]|nr:hypothetical protein EDC96DRAFT_573907 [Choanephora cucurbitarum]
MTKKRPNTWTCCMHTQTSIHPWKHYSVEYNATCSARQTITTISTLTSSSTMTYHLYQPPDKEPIIHAQSMLFLFGFLFFPCWWIGGFCLKVNRGTLDDLEKSVMVHPSLLANGKTASRILESVAVGRPIRTEQTSVYIFYQWNRYMSMASIGILVVVIALVIWYLVQ